MEPKYNAPEDAMMELLGIRIKAAKKVGAESDVSDAEEFLMKYKEEDYVPSDSEILNYLNEVENSYVPKLKNIIESHKNLVELAGKLKKGYKDPSLEAAEKSFNEGNYEGLYDLLKEVWKDAEKVIHTKFSIKYSVVKELVSIEENKEAEKLLGIAKRSLEVNDYHSALYYLNDAMSILQQ